MKHLHTPLSLLVAIATLSACSWMPDGMMGTSGSSTASQQDNNLYSNERTARWGQAPEKTPALITTPAPAPAETTPEPTQAPTQAPVTNAEPLIERNVTK